jgi:hypothetical protein
MCIGYANNCLLSAAAPDVRTRNQKKTIHTDHVSVHRPDQLADVGAFGIVRSFCSWRSRPRHQAGVFRCAVRQHIDPFGGTATRVCVHIRRRPVRVWTTSTADITYHTASVSTGDSDSATSRCSTYLATASGWCTWEWLWLWFWWTLPGDLVFF